MGFRQFVAAAIAVFLITASACADLLVTYKRNYNVNGSSFSAYDMAKVGDNSASLYFDHDLISGDQRITGFHSVSKNRFLFTTQGSFSIGSNSYDRGDIVSYDKSTGESSLVFDSALLSDTRIKALSRFDNGDIAFTLNRNFTLGSTNYRRGDVVRYSTALGTHSLYFDVDDINANARHIEALHVISDTKLILSHSRRFTLGGIVFRRGDLVHYDTATGVASLYRSRDTLANETRITALSVETVPEPGQLAVLLILFSIVGLVVWRRKQGVRVASAQ